MREEIGFHRRLSHIPWFPPIPENVIAGADCGFATLAGMHSVNPKISWAKLQTLVEGARLASEQIWGKHSA